MAKYVKLGEKAESFFDPLTRLKINKGKVVEMDNAMKLSKKIQTALKGGHLVYAEAQEYKDFIKSVKVPEAKTVDSSKATDADTIDLSDEKKLTKLNKPTLIGLVLSNELTDDEDEVYTAETLEGLDKKDLVAILVESTLEEDEEDEDDEDDDEE